MRRQRIIKEYVAVAKDKCVFCFEKMTNPNLKNGNISLLKITTKDNEIKKENTKPKSLIMEKY